MCLLFHQSFWSFWNGQKSMGLYLKFLALPFSTLTTEVSQVLVEGLLSGRHTRARIGGTQAAFLLFTYSFSCGQLNIVWQSSSLRETKGTLHWAQAYKSGSWRYGRGAAQNIDIVRTLSGAEGRGSSNQCLTSPSDLGQWLLWLRPTWEPEGRQPMI